MRVTFWATQYSVSFTWKNRLKDIVHRLKKITCRVLSWAFVHTDWMKLKTESQQVLLVHDIPFPAIAHKHVRYLTLHLHSPTSTPAAPRAHSGGREVKEQQGEKWRQNWKQNHSDTREPLKGCSKRSEQGERTTSQLTIQTHKNLQVTKK